ncbi:hypothetical protein Agub_g9588 [Astrephomene gubernaculifera]|uniref:Kinesin motor domain-containing protein n=1 Tax=Astrephomene gubernaculifera TaxID=47775 RepID=A0AAD3HP68_9CHLO|nr:hypothetical protein Agub_g9588 [Astrephomene gubernaculifera]
MADATIAKAAPAAGENEGVNVQVLLRCRPMSDKEIAERTPQVISCNEVLREATLYQNVGGKQMSRTFRFDKVFSSEASQEKLFKQAIVPIVQEVMEGFNCTIFAYGQTGTGKTYTMEGGPRRSDDGKSLSAEAGVIPRSIKQIFDTIEANNADSTVKVTFLELYNEELTDLLSFDDVKDDSKRLRLLEDRNGVVVQGLEEVVVKSATEIYQVLDRGTAKRRTAETLLNKRSSRSHSVFSITIHMRESSADGEDVVKVGKLNLVDLAGSENISRSGAKDGRAREAGSINQSLLTLGRVITALVEHSGHVPYRDSKLTRLLRESLGGKTKTCIIATIAPTVQCQEETISTLDYAHRAKNIRNRPEVNQKISKTAMIREMSTEMEKLRMELVAQREKNGVYVPVEKHQQDEVERMQLRDTVKALREELKAEQEEFAQTLEQQKTEAEKNISRLETELATARTNLQRMDATVQAATRTIHERQYLIAAQRQAEQDIVDHAEAMRMDLAAAVRDVGELFASLDELTSVNDGDRDAFKHIQALIKARIEDIGASLSAAVDRQQQQLSAMNEALRAFKQQKQQELQQLAANVATVQSTVTSMRESVERRGAEAEAGATAALSCAGEAAAAHAAAAVSAAEKLEAASRGAVDALVQSIEKQVDQLTAFAKQQASSADSFCESLRNSMTRLTGNLGNLQDAAAQAQTSVEQQTAALSGGLGGLAVRIQEDASRRQAALMAQIAALVQSFTDESSAEVAKGVRALQQQAEEGSEAVRGRLVQVSQTATTAIGEVKEVTAAITGGVQEDQQRVGSHTTDMTASLKRIGEDARGIHVEVAAQLKCSAESAVTYRHEAEQHCSRSTAAVHEAIRSCIATASEDAASTQRMLDGVKDTVEAATGRDDKVADEWASSCSTAAADIAGFREQHLRSLSVLDGEVDAVLQKRMFVERQVMPPARRELDIPPASSLQDLRCPPEEVLVERCHAECPQIFAVPLVQSGSLSGSLSPRTSLALSTSGLARENETPLRSQPSVLVPAGAQLAATSSGLQSPRSTAGLRSRIPSKPSLMGASPSVKDLTANVTTRPLLADKTNSKSSILTDWAA